MCVCGYMKQGYRKTTRKLAAILSVFRVAQVCVSKVMSDRGRKDEGGKVGTKP